MVLPFYQMSNTMPHVLTVKISHPLLERLEKASRIRGKSKGAFVREAIEKELFQKAAPFDEGLERIRAATESMRQGKRIKVKVDWERLRRKAALGTPPGMTPEEEVRLHRRRGL